MGSDIVKRAKSAPVVPEEIAARLKEIRARIAGIDATVLGLRRQIDLARIYRVRTLDAISHQAALAPEHLPGGHLDLERWGKTLDELSRQEQEALGKTRALEVSGFAFRKSRKNWNANGMPIQRPNSWMSGEHWWEFLLRGAVRYPFTYCTA